MCGRYLFTQEKENKELWQIADAVREKYPDREMKLGEIFPTNDVPILIGRQNEVTSELLTWGFPNFRNKGVIINARSETAAEKKMFKNCLLSKRCVVPATGFFEWSHDTEKRKYQFNVPESKALYMAGLYNEFAGENRFVILTTSANASMSDIHDRMPVILKQETITDWIFDTARVFELMQQQPPKLMRAEVQK